MNRAISLWIVAGQSIAQKHSTLAPSISEERMLFAEGGVRLTLSESATAISWHGQSRCVSSLYVAMAELRKAKPPFIFHFNISGWFRERHESVEAARHRLEALIHCADRHFHQRTYVVPIAASEKLLSPYLLSAFTRSEIDPARSVDCTANQAGDRFHISRVGAVTPLGKVYGTATNTFPCMSTAHTSRVGEGYVEVLNRGKPRAEHVLARFLLPNNQLRWVPYHRVILPLRGARNDNHVRVVSELAPVHFSVL